MKIQKFTSQSGYFTSNSKNSRQRLKPGQFLLCNLENDGQVLCKYYQYREEEPYVNSLDAELRFSRTVSLVPEEIINSPKELFNTKILNFYHNTLWSPLKDVQVLEEDPVEFKSITVDVFIHGKAFKNNLIQDRFSLERVLKGFLTFFTFSKNCLLDLGSFKENYGIEKIYVKDVSPENQSSKIGFIGSKTIIHLANTFTWTKHLLVDLVGCEDLENNLTELITFKFPHKTYWPRLKLLIIGPSGTGKTCLVRNIAIKLNCFLLEILNNDVIGSMPGDTEIALRNIFQKAHDMVKMFNDQKLIIFIRNTDTFCPKDIDPSNSSHVRRSSTLLMNLLENIEDEQIVVLATTSNIEEVSLNLRRPGRINEEFYIKMPDLNERFQILSKLIAKKLGSHDFNELLSDQLSWRTNGYVAADIALIVKHIERGILKKERDGKRIHIDDCTSIIDEVLRKVRPSIGKGEFECKIVTDKTFDSIGGMESLKQKIRVSVLGPLERPEVYERFGLSPPRGILLYGPPGCAKTTFAQCIAHETKMSFLSASAADVYSPYVGKAEKYLVKIFNQARAMAPAIIFLDEIDSLVGTRSGNTHDVQNRILSTLLTEMDGIGGRLQTSVANKSKVILVIAATNRPDMIDDALMRPGRFDKLIHIPAPDEAARLAVLKKRNEKIPFDTDVNLEELARRTNYFSGADVLNLCNEAALIAATENLDASIVNMSHFNKALEEVRPSLTVNQIKNYEVFENKCKRS